MAKEKVHDFRESIKKGEEGERLVSPFLHFKYSKVRDVSKDIGYQNLDVDYAVCNASGKEYLIEVKNDVMSLVTGNLFFETKSNKNYNTQGCFLKTKADYWYVLSGTMLRIFNTKDIRKWVMDRESKWTVKEIRNKRRYSDDYYSIGLLVPIKEIPEFLYEIVDLKEDFLKKISEKNKDGL